MKVDYPGLLRETTTSGTVRTRVRVEGNPRKRIRLHLAPGDPGFDEAYHAARAGIELPPPVATASATAIRGSIAWLVDAHMQDLARQVEAGQSSPLTLKKRRGLMAKFRGRFGEFALEMPQAELVRYRDSLSATPAMADSMVEAVSAVYRWGSDRGLCAVNPAVGIARIDRGKGGAVPWTADDLRRYRAHHEAGTVPHLALTLFMFTACRIGDAILLGRGHETMRDGLRTLAWQPRKRGSAFVQIPMAPPLYRATRAATVQGATYLLNYAGKPFSSPDSLGQMFRRWCDQAGLEGRSSHGIRKAAGHLLAEQGCSQYMVMAIHGHTQAKTSEVYTKAVDRWRLAAEAMQRIEGMEW